MQTAGGKSFEMRSPLCYNVYCGESREGVIGIMYKFAVLGYGARGSLYAGMLSGYEDFGCAAVCDIDRERLDVAAAALKLKEEQLFDNADDFFAANIKADVLVLATMDRTHCKYALEALDHGYNLLLEKPIAETIPECYEIERRAKAKGLKVSVCHVLRYSPFYNIIKQRIDSGELGEPVTINQTENVGYWHQAHSFVRGNWGNSDASSPMILQKCCHDTDIFCYMLGRRAKAVSSFGSLKFFNAAHAPEGSADFCYKCARRGECPFDCIKYYTGGCSKEWLEKIGFYGDRTDAEGITKTLSDESNPFARCVFRCDNNVVDHQVLNIQFEDEITAHLTMTAFSDKCVRTIKVHLTGGEIVGDMEENTIRVTKFGGKTEVLDVAKLTAGIAGHGGGDSRLVEDLVNVIRGKGDKMLTDITQSVHSHEIALAAEISRVNGGKVVEVG